MAGVWGLVITRLLVWLFPHGCCGPHRRDARPLARAEIIAVGSELLTPTKTDTNSLVRHRTCSNELGIEVRAKAIVGDRQDDRRGDARLALGARRSRRSDRRARAHR